MHSHNHFEILDNLQGKLLIASPKMKDTCFEKAVIYMCKHSKDGAMGLVLNRALPENKKIDIIQQLSTGSSLIEGKTLPSIYLGGPVEIFRGFILHSDEYSSAGTEQLDNGLALSSSIEVFNDIMHDKGPRDSFIALGYAGWGAGQLEKELESDSWLHTEMDKNLIFSNKTFAKWEQATRAIGVRNMLHYSSVIGHA